MSFIATAAASAAIAFCAVIPGCAPSATAKPVCAGDRIVIAWNAETDCDLTPPQTLTLDYSGVSNWTQDCLDQGGVVSADPDKDECEHIDY